MLQPMGLQRVRQDLTTKQQQFLYVKIIFCSTRANFQSLQFTNKETQFQREKTSTSLHKLVA